MPAASKGGGRARGMGGGDERRRANTPAGGQGGGGRSGGSRRAGQAAAAQNLGGGTGGGSGGGCTPPPPPPPLPPTLPQANTSAASAGLAQTGSGTLARMAIHALGRVGQEGGCVAAWHGGHVEPGSGVGAGGADAPARCQRVGRGCARVTKSAGLREGAAGGFFPAKPRDPRGGGDCRRLLPPAQRA